MAVARRGAAAAAARGTGRRRRGSGGDCAAAARDARRGEARGERRGGGGALFMEGVASEAWERGKAGAESGWVTATAAMPCGGRSPAGARRRAQARWVGLAWPGWLGQSSSAKGFFLNKDFPDKQK